MTVRREDGRWGDQTPTEDVARVVAWESQNTAEARLRLGKTPHEHLPSSASAHCGVTSPAQNIW